MKKYITEFIGTFFLVLTIGLVVIEPGAGALAPVAIGAVLMAMIYAGGHISGAHYNPAITLAFWARKRCDTRDVPFYIISQILAALAASFCILSFKTGSIVSAQPLDILPALAAEFIFTFALSYVILNVATSKKSEGNSYYGLAIGFTVTAGAYAVGPVSGAIFNPAVALGVNIVGLSNIQDIWILLTGEITGALAGSFMFLYLNPDDR